MKLKYWHLLPLVVLMASCRDDDDEAKRNANNPNYYVNSWIYDNMKTYYLWEEHIPAGADKTLAPAEYFGSLLYREQDRFSWIQENYAELLNSLSGVQMEAGYEYALYLKEYGGSDVIGVVTYIKPNSPASHNNLKRGDIFIEINGMRLTKDNYQSAVSGMKSQHVLGLASADDLSSVSREIALSVVEYKEHPILLDTIYSIDGRGIGYLVYNFFANDNGDGSFSYVLALNDALGRFKRAGISDLIVDMRYNGGGAVSTAIALASMIGSQHSTDVFSTAQYNALLSASYQRQYGRDYDKDYFVDKVGSPSQDINQLGMSRLYVITAHGTASASELIINCLRPYMPVIIIGDTTYGKNVGSYSLFTPNDSKNRWGMQPIVVKFANKDGMSDYGTGFVPDVRARETSDGHPLKPLGDTQETLLRITLDHLLGRTTAVSPMTRSIRTTIPTYQIYNSHERSPSRQHMWIDKP
jgi:C-terminal processing protease CtpA/Prc